MFSKFILYFIFAFSVSIIHSDFLLSSDQKYSLIELPLGFDVPKSGKVINEKGTVAGTYKSSAAIWDPKKGLILLEKPPSSCTWINEKGFVSIHMRINQTIVSVPFFWNPFKDILIKGPTGFIAHFINDDNTMIVSNSTQYFLWNPKKATISKIENLNKLNKNIHGKIIESNLKGLINSNNVSVYRDGYDLFIEKEGVVYFVDVHGFDWNVYVPTEKYSYYINDNDFVAVVFNKNLYIVKSSFEVERIQLIGDEKNGDIINFTSSGFVLMKATDNKGVNKVFLLKLQI